MNTTVQENVLFVRIKQGLKFLNEWAERFDISEQEITDRRLRALEQEVVALRQEMSRGAQSGQGSAGNVAC